MILKLKVNIFFKCQNLVYSQAVYSRVVYGQVGCIDYGPRTQCTANECYSVYGRKQGIQS